MFLRKTTDVEGMCAGDVESAHTQATQMGSITLNTAEDLIGCTSMWCVVKYHAHDIHIKKEVESENESKKKTNKKGKHKDDPDDPDDAMHPNKDIFC